MKTLAALIATAYLATGAWFGYALSTVMKPVNTAGVIYVALTWPAWIKGSPIHLPAPKWAFSFGGAK